jgi:hypothetical protein
VNDEFERGVAIGKAMESAAGCICRGNWRDIIRHYEPALDTKFRDTEGRVWTFFGIVHGKDDYYYGMCRNGDLELLSCVGSIEGYGYLPVERQ